MSDIPGETAPTQQHPAAPTPPAAPYATRPPRRPLPGWGWGLIVAGTAIVALLVGGGFGFGAGLVASHVRSGIAAGYAYPGAGGAMPGLGSGDDRGSGSYMDRDRDRDRDRSGTTPSGPAPSATPNP